MWFVWILLRSFGTGLFSMRNNTKFVLSLFIDNLLLHISNISPWTDLRAFHISQCLYKIILHSQQYAGAYFFFRYDTKNIFKCPHIPYPSNFLNVISFYFMETIWMQNILLILFITMFYALIHSFHYNGRDSVSNRQPHDCLLNRLFRRRSKKTSTLRVTGLCVQGIHRGPVSSQHKWTVTRKMFPFDDAIMYISFSDLRDRKHG